MSMKSCRGLNTIQSLGGHQAPHEYGGDDFCLSALVWMPIHDQGAEGIRAQDDACTRGVPVSVLANRSLTG